MKGAIIDLGSNTFQLFMYEYTNDELKELGRNAIACRVGEGSFREKMLTDDGINRGVLALKEFKAICEMQGISSPQIKAVGTSALREATNHVEFCDRVLRETDISIEIIDGMMEANYIYLGVCTYMKVTEPSLIVDIGGGSVEFILANSEKVLWQKSFEIGGLRLMDLFMKKDPLPQAMIPRIEDYLRSELLLLANACHQYAPAILIGSAGSFESLIDIRNCQKTDTKGTNVLTVQEFKEIYLDLLSKGIEERLAVKGLIPGRAKMIVIACVLIDYLLETFQLREVHLSKHSLKEGVCVEQVGIKKWNS